MGDTWRVGHKVPINVYAVSEAGVSRPVCQCHTPEDAARIVEAMNSMEAMRPVLEMALMKPGPDKMKRYNVVMPAIIEAFNK